MQSACDTEAALSQGAVMIGPVKQRDTTNCWVFVYHVVLKIGSARGGQRDVQRCAVEQGHPVAAIVQPMIVSFATDTLPPGIRAGFELASSWYYLGPPVLDLLEKIHLPFGLLGSLVPLALILWWTIRARQDLGKRGTVAMPVEREILLRAGAMAGLLATVGSTLLMNVAINLAGGIAFNAPGTLVERTAARLAFALARDVQPVFLFIAVPIYLAVGVMWGAVYGMWGEARLPAQWADWQRGVFFAVLPLLVSVLVVLPVLGLGVLGLGATGQVAFTGELIRHAVFGVLLGLMFPVFRARRPIKVRPHTPAELAAEPVVRAEV